VPVLSAIRRSSGNERGHGVPGPHRTEFVLEYRNPETGDMVRMSRSNLHVLRTIAEQVFHELVWKA
ncbi:MAG: hypothetical protein ACM3VT_05425, partial [Solirubrobacterales bacterium]